uniref:Thioredoxin domain-containing protein n=1 Tax=viral metagenome TaxID=1070528 RepID=A0A6C0H8V5_9ZZZZ
MALSSLMSSTSPSSFLNKLKELTCKMNIKNILIIFLAIVLIIVIYYIYTKYFSNGFGRTIENMENQTSDKTAELMLFHVDWCPHCKTAKPEWDQVKAEYENKSINGYKVMFNEINCTDETSDKVKMIETYKIEGYPTIKLVKDNQVIDFDAKPTKETLTKFLNTVL